MGTGSEPQLVINPPKTVQGSVPVPIFHGESFSRRPNSRRPCLVGGLDDPPESEANPVLPDQHDGPPEKGDRHQVGYLAGELDRPRDLEPVPFFRLPCR